MFASEDAYEIWLRNAIYAAPAILYGVLLIWAFFSHAKWLRSRWYLRIAIPLAVCGLLLPTRLFGVALYALITLVLLVAAFGLLTIAMPLLRRTLRRKPADDEQLEMPFRFGLRDALLVTALCALALAIGTYAVRSADELLWKPLILSAACYCLLIFITAAAAFVRFPRAWLRWTLFALWFPAAAGLCLWWASLDWLQMGELYDFDLSFIMIVRPAPIFDTPMNVAVMIAIGLCLCAWVTCWTGNADSRWRRTWGRIVLPLVGLPLIIATCWLYALLLFPTTKPPDVVLEDNAHDDFVAALSPLTNVIGLDYETATEQDLQTFEDFYASDLQAVERVIDRPIAIQPTWTMDDLDLPTMPARIVTSVHLTRGKFLEAAGDHSAAVDEYLQTAQLGEACRRGGLLVDNLVGNAIEDPAFSALARQRKSLPAPDRRRVIELLQAIDAQQEPVTLILQRDRYWCDRALGAAGRLHNAVCDMTGEYEELTQISVNAMHRHCAKRRMLFTELAILSFHADHGRFPKALNELVPGYLNAVPSDPYDGRPLKYRPDPTATHGFVLYSVGVNRIDDGGQQATLMAATVDGQGDFFLDARDEDSGESE